MPGKDVGSFRWQFLVVRSWLWLAIVTAALGAAAAYAISSQTPITYVSTVSIFIGPPLGGAVNIADLDVGLALRQTYADLATTRPVLERVIQATGVRTTVDDLAPDVAARVPVNSSLLLISVTYRDGRSAAAFANAIAADLAAFPPSAKAPASPANVGLTVVDPAVAPATPESRRIPLTVGLGAAVGLMLAICVAFLIENLRDEGRPP
ncbi:MAG: YveK family protein [Candidatus Limnocylindrales bacterium]